MKIVSTNLASPSTFNWKGKEEITGIFKRPTERPIYLEKNKVKGDEVSDRKHHGGPYKACYLFSSDHYAHWKNLYPNLEWTYGMFGENLTVSGLDETQITVGDIYKIGNAILQITQPREPCYKLGVKFGTQTILKQFNDHGCPGTYASILQEGHVAVGDKLELVESANNSLTVSQLFELIYVQQKNQELLKIAIQLDAIPQTLKAKLSNYLNK